MNGQGEMSEKRRIKMKKNSREQRFEDFCYKIFHMSGISDLDVPIDQPEFSQIAMTITHIYNGKSELYGNHLKRLDKDDFMAMMESYNEIKRKYSRIDNWVRTTINNGSDFEPCDLVESYSDLAAYSIMGLLTIFELMERANDRS